MLKVENSRFQDTEFDYGGILYRGRSVGSEETCHQLPGFDLCFDIGGAPMSSTPIVNVFITHGHNDHIGGIIKHYLRRQSWGLDSANYYVPHYLYDHVLNYFAAQGALGYGAYNTPKDLKLFKVNLGDAIQIGPRYVTPFKVFHRAPCYGYTVWSKKSKLKPEYLGLSEPEIRDLAKSGKKVSDVLEVPEASFCGDTSIDIITMPNSPVKKTRLLMLECSFIDDQVSIAESRGKGHIHLDEIKAAIDEGLFDENERVLLTHFSARYSVRQIGQAIRELPQKFIPLI